MKEELNKAGCKVSELPEGMEIDGINQINPTVFDSHNDHRVAMALSLLTLKCSGDIKILGAESVSKSFPNYWSVFESLGGNVIYEK